MMDDNLQKIYNAGLKFLVPLNAEETYKRIIEEAKKLVGADFGHITMDRGGELIRVYVSDPLIYKIKPRKKGYMYKVIHTRKPIILHYDDVIDVQPAIKEMGIKCIMGIPLLNRNKSFGVMGLYSLKDNHFTQKKVKLLQVFTPLASLAIRKVQLFEETTRALETRDLFISMAAHELRTPVTTISGYTQLLNSKLGGADTSESRWIKELNFEVVRLGHLINELLEVNRISSGQLRYVWKECSLREIIKHSLADARIVHPLHQVIFEDNAKEGEDIVIGDFDKLLQAILNVLENSAKFSPPNTEITVSLKTKKLYLVLEIKDKGTGISKKDMQVIYEKFYKGTGHSKEGMGLGLFLVKNIIRQHHGSIDIKSRENKGTETMIKLPRIKNG